MEEDGPLLAIALENVGGTSWWASVLTTLASQTGMSQFRFIGTIDGERVYRGATFPVPGTVGSLPPEEQWAPGMTQSLRDLKLRIAADGWVQVGSGPEPWAATYRRREADRTGPSD